MLNQKYQKYVLLYSLVVLLLPLTTSAQTPAVPVSTDISAPVSGHPGDIAASGDGQVITSVWNAGDTQYVSIATLNSGTWAVQQTISRLGGNAPASVAISNDGNVIVSGDPSQDQVFIYSRGSATAGMWSWVSTIIGTVGHQFGSAVALNDTGNILAVAAPRADRNVNTQGAVYIYEQSGENWVERTIIRPLSESLEFAQDVALSGNGLTLAVGVAPSLVGDITGRTEAVHLFSRAAAADVSMWGEPDIITASDPFVGDDFGDAVALNTVGNILAVGARNQSDIDNGAFGAGAVYIFQRGNEVGSWPEQQRIKPSGELDNALAKAEFGTSIDLNGAGDQLVVGAPVNNGATYLYGFNEVSANWAELNIIRGGFFAGQGNQVALNDEYLVTSEFGSISVVELDSVISNVIIDRASLSLAEGSRDSVTVNLEYDPASEVILRVTSDGEGLTISPSQTDVSTSEVVTFIVGAASDIVSGEQILTFSADGYASTQLTVTVISSASLGSLVLPATAEITEGPPDLTVMVAVNGQDVPADTVAMIVVGGQNTDGLVFPQFTGGNADLQTLIDDGMTIRADADNIYTGDREITVTLSADRYEQAIMTLTIIDSVSDIRPTITVDPSELSLSRGASAELVVSIGAERRSILRVPVIAGEAITVSPAMLEFGIRETSKVLTVTADDGTYEPYITSSVSFDIPPDVSNNPPPVVEVQIDGQFNLVEGTDSTFGRSVSLSGNDQVMAVGTVSGKGSVDVYTKDDFGRWQFAQTLTANNAETGDQFGSAIAISDDGHTITIGAPEEDSTKTDIITGNVVDDNEPTNHNAGAVYIFTRNVVGGQWTQQTYIKASNALAALVNANFGVSLSLSDNGNTLAVGANGEIIPAVAPDPATAEGAVYIFRYDGTLWSEANYLKIEAAILGDDAEFGTNVALSGDGMTLAVGSPRACTDARNDGLGGFSCLNPIGVVNVFTSNSGDWSEAYDVRAPLFVRNSINSNVNHGSSVELNRDGTTLVVGVSNELVVGVGSGLAQRKGAVDIFTKENDLNDLWEYRQQITVPNGEDNDRFGADVTINSIGTVLAIGAPGDDSGATGMYQSGDFSFDDNNSDNAGAVYMYRLNADGMYQHLLSLKPGVTTREGLEYGTAVSLSAGDGGRGSLAIGAAGLFEIVSYSEGAVIIPPPTFSLLEGSSRTVSVSLVQIGGSTVTINIEPGSGLSVEPNSLTFSNEVPQNVVVTAIDNHPPGGNRSSTLRLTADNANYPSETVTVNIIEDDPEDLQPIDLTMPVTDLMLTVLSSTSITVMVGTENVDLLVETTGSVSLLPPAASGSLNSEVLDLDADTPAMIDIFSGLTAGNGTVKLTFSGAGLTTEVRTVEVSVETGSLIIDTVDRLTVDGNNPERFIINITGSARFVGDLEVTLRIEEIGTENLVDVVRDGNAFSDVEPLVVFRQLRSGDNIVYAVEVGRVLGSAGDTMIRVTATPPALLQDAVMRATKDIFVTVNRPQIELTVTPLPSLTINRDTAESLMVGTDVVGQVPTITVAASTPNIVSVSNNFAVNGEIVLTGLTTGLTTLTIRATADDYVSAMADVEVIVVDDFNIEVEDPLTGSAVETLTVNEGSTQAISVSLSQLRDVTVMVNIRVEGALAVSSSNFLSASSPDLTFTAIDAQSVTVEGTDEDTVYTENPATLTLTADGYPDKIITVNIIDNDRRQVGLDVPADDLELVRFASTNILVTVDVGTNVLVETQGMVSLSADGTTATRIITLADRETTQVTIYGVDEGTGAVTFTVGGTGLIDDSRTVSVLVMRPVLEISAVSPLNIDLDTLGDTEGLEVTVNAVGGQNVTLTATVESNVDNLVIVSPLEQTGVIVGTEPRFEVESDDTAGTAGTATVTITASHPDYNSANVKFTVNVFLRDIGLIVDTQPLNIVTERTGELTIEVGADVDADIDITVTSGDSDIASVVVLPFTLRGTADSSTMIEVTAGDTFGVGTTLRITASATGYMKAEAVVPVEILDLLRIQVSPSSFELVEGQSTQITVSVNRLDGPSVRINSEPRNSDLGNLAGLQVARPQPSLNSINPTREFTVRSIGPDGIYRDEPRDVEFMLTASGYESTTVSVRILEADLPPVPLSVTSPSIDMGVLGVVTGMTEQLIIAVTEDIGTDVNITVESDDSDIASVVPASEAEFTLMGSANRTIDIRGGNTVGSSATLTIEASAAGHATVTETVTVEVLEILSITADPNTFTLAEAVNGMSSSRQITVTLSRREGNVVLTPMPALSTLGLQGIMSTNFLGTEQVFTVTTINDDDFVGDRTVEFMLTAPGYDSETVSVRIIEDDLSDIGFSLMPSTIEGLQVVVGSTAPLTIGVTASTDISITVESDDSAIASLENEAMDSAFTLTGGTSNSTRTIVVSGNRFEAGVLRDATLTIMASPVEGSILDAVVTFIDVDVLDILRIEADDIPNLVEGTSMDIDVALNRIESAEVTVSIDATAGTTGLEVRNADGMPVSELRFTTATPDSRLRAEAPLTVRAVDNFVYDGPRTATITLTADGYATETVTVNIIEDERSITLGIDGDRNINLLTFANTPITATVEEAPSGGMLPDVILNVATQGAVTLAGGAMSDRLTVSVGDTSGEIEISGASVGSGTVTFTAVGPKVISDPVEVYVTVSTPKLVISNVSALDIDLLTFATTNLEVTVNTEAGSTNVTVTAEVTGDNVVAVAQPTRNVQVGTAGTQETFRVSSDADDGTATIMITARSPGYASTSAEVTVNVSLQEIGLTVTPSPELDIVVGSSALLTIGVGASTDVNIMVSSNKPSIADPSKADFFLTGGTINSQVTINVDGVALGDATLTIEALVGGYRTQTETVSVNVLDTLRIEVDGSDEPNSSFDLIEGMSRNIDVNLSRVEGIGPIMVNIEATAGTTGLEVKNAADVIVSDLNFTTTDSQSISVTAANNEDYNGPRTAILTLTAPGYATQTVTVNIMDDDIGLDVDSPNNLSLLRFTSTEITVSVDDGAELLVETGGAVSLSEDGNTTMTMIMFTDAGMTPVRIHGVGEGQGTVTFTVSGAMKTTEMRVLSVEVTRPTLEISAVSISATLDTLVMADLEVTVNTEAGEADNVTVAADVDTTGGAMVSVTPASRDVRVGTADTQTTFVVDSGADMGTATIMITASDSNDNYDVATAEVTVNVALRTDIGLMVDPLALGIVTGETGELTIEVGADANIGITITSADSDRASVMTPDSSFTLNGAIATSSSRTVTVTAGNDFDMDTMLTIEASAAGYDTQTVMVPVDVLDTLRIEVDGSMDLSFDLAEGATRQISVSLSRVEGTEVIVDIDAPDGITVRDNTNALVDELTFTTAESGPQSIIVEAVNDNDYDRDRLATITLMDRNTNYSLVEVMVNIIEDDIGLTGTLSESEPTVGTTVGLTIEAIASTDVRIMVSSSDSDIASVVDSTFTLTGANGMRTITVNTEAPGNATLTITASAAGHDTVTETVTVEVLDILRITAIPNSFELMEAEEGSGAISKEASTEIRVILNRIEGDGPITVNTAVTDGLSAQVSFDIPSESRNNVLTVNTPFDRRYIRNATLTLTATGYATETVTVTIVERQLPPIGLTVIPSGLEAIIGTTVGLTIGVSVDTDVDITVMSDNSTVVSVPDSAASFVLESDENSTTIEVNANTMGNAGLTIVASAGNDYAVETIPINLNVQNRFRIEAPGMFVLNEGATTQIEVSLSQIQGTDSITVGIEATGDITVTDGTNPTTLTELMFTATNPPTPQTITVIADNDGDYMGDRTAMIMLTADDYATETVTVNIMEDELQPIGLNVASLDSLRLLRFASRNIEVTVEVEAELLIETEGAVSLSDDGAITMSRRTLNPRMAEVVTIHGVNEDAGTVTFTVSGDRLVSASRTVSVTVDRPTLEISSVNMLNLDTLVTGADLEVTVNAAAGEPVNVTVTAVVDVTGGAAVTVEEPTIRNVDVRLVNANPQTTFEVNSGDREGTATIMITASHDDYIEATAEVTVNVALRNIGLTVDPQTLGIVIDTERNLTIRVGPNAVDDIGITVTSGDSGRASVMTPDSSFTLNGAIATSSSRTVTVTAGNDFEMDTTLTIEATAMGYATTEVMVPVDVLDTLRIEVDQLSQLSFDLDEGANRQISVSLSRVEGTEVIVDIDAPDGITVTDNTDTPVTELTFTPAESGPQSITVEANNVDRYIGDRSATLTLMDRNANYPTAEVMVRIIEDQLPPVGLTITPLELEPVVGTTAELTISVSASTDVSIMVVPSDTNIARVASPAAFTLTGGTANASTTVEVSGDAVGNTVLLIEVSAAASSDQTVIVPVRVLDTLRIEVDGSMNLSFDLDERATRQISVSLSRVEGTEVIVDIDVPDGITVRDNTDNPVDELTFTPAESGPQSIIVEANNVDGYIGNRSATIMLVAMNTNYPTAEVVVDIIEDELPPVGLTITPSALAPIVGTTVGLTIAVSESTDVTVMVMSDDSTIASLVDSEFTLNGGAANSSRTIIVSGSTIGMTFLTIRVSADGYAIETRTIGVDVQSTFRIIAEPSSFSLDEGMERQTSVSLSIIEGTTPITVSIEAPDGITVRDDTNALVDELTFTTTAVQSITVEANNVVGYIGDRSAMIRLTADDYAEAIVTVDIIEDELQPVGLNVVSSTELSLVRFASTSIEVNVEVGTELLVETGGSVALSMEGDQLPERIQLTDMGTVDVTIYAVEEGDGTVRFTVGGGRQMTKIVELNVNVTRPKLEISSVTVPNIVLLTSEQTTFGVTINAEAGTPTDVTLEASVTRDSMNREVATVNPASTDVQVDDLTTLTVKANATRGGPATITIMASHPDYVSATTDVAVMVELRTIDLMVDPDALDITVGTTGILRITATPTTATITVSSDDDTGITDLAPSEDFALDLNTDVVELPITGLQVGGPVTLTIVARAEGHFSRTVSGVLVNVLDTLRIEVDGSMNLSFDLDEGTTRQISVSLSRVEGTEVIVDIDAPGGITVRDDTNALVDELTFTTASPGPQSIIVEANNVDGYIGNRSATIMLVATNTNYPTAEVVVDIIEDELQPIGLSVDSSSLEVVVGMTTELTISVSASTDVSITVTSADTATASVMDPDSSFILNGSTAAGSSRTITVTAGDTFGVDTTLTIEATADGYEQQEVPVRVNVTEAAAAALRFRLKVFLEGAQ